MFFQLPTLEPWHAGIGACELIKIIRSDGYFTCRLVQLCGFVFVVVVYFLKARSQPLIWNSDHMHFQTPFPTYPFSPSGLTCPLELTRHSFDQPEWLHRVSTPSHPVVFPVSFTPLTPVLSVPGSLAASFSKLTFNKEKQNTIKQLFLSFSPLHWSGSGSCS